MTVTCPCHDVGWCLICMNQHLVYTFPWIKLGGPDAPLATDTPDSTASVQGFAPLHCDSTQPTGLAPPQTSLERLPRHAQSCTWCSTLLYRYCFCCTVMFAGCLTPPASRTPTSSLHVSICESLQRFCHAGGLNPGPTASQSATAS
jgi:hypothetical protein